MNRSKRHSTGLISHEDLKSRIKWLMIFRVGLMTILLGASLLFQIGKDKSLPSVYLPAILLGTIYLLTLLYSFSLSHIQRLSLFAMVQLVMDVLIETLLVMFTGSVESPFSFLYILTIISAALLIGRSGSFFTASLAFISYGLIVDLEYYQIGWFRYFAPPSLSEREASYSFFLYLVVFFTVAVLSGTLADKLSWTKKALEERDRGLSAFKAFHENVVRSMGSGLLTANPEGAILSFNAAAELITGFVASEITGRKWWEVFGWDYNPASLLKSNGSRGTIRFEKEGQKKNGKRLLLGMTLSDLKDDEGQKKGFVGTFQDLTKIKEMEETIQLKERLAHLGEMAAGIAHEIRNPLASLSGSMEILSQELMLKDHHQRLMQIALSETERLNKLISDFLNYTRPRLPQKRELRLKVFLEEEMVLFKNSVAQPDDFHLELDVDPFMKPVFLDPDLLKQVFWNLSINAMEAMPNGGKLKISARIFPAKGEGEECHLLFEDNGLGISQESIGKIFNPFYSTKEQGSGLGLSIVHRIVEEHGGRIFVRSEPGKMTQFRLVFPMNPDEVRLTAESRQERVVG